VSESPSYLWDELSEAVAWDDAAVERFGEYAPLHFGGRPEVALWLHETYCCSAEHGLAPMRPAGS
jgi:hypothetical protein